MGSDKEIFNNMLELSKLKTAINPMMEVMYKKVFRKNLFPNDFREKIFSMKYTSMIPSTIPMNPEWRIADNEFLKK
jgi:hypothetical protein